MVTVDLKGVPANPAGEIGQVEGEGEHDGQFHFCEIVRREGNVDVCLERRSKAVLRG